MNIQNILIISILALAGVILTSTQSRAQVDSAWLSSWNEAQVGRPDNMTSSGRIAAENEPGISLIIRGQILEPDGSPAQEVVVHGYHRDHHGFDFGPGDNSVTTWRLQGWVETDAQGRFEFQTIRPAADHLGREGAHIHFTLESGEFGRQWAPMIFLSDDPLVTADQHRQSEAAEGFAWIREIQTTDGVQNIDVRIKLKEQADF